MKKLYFMVIILWTLGSTPGTAQFFERQNFHLISVTAETFNYGYQGAAWGDLNQDGFLDLVAGPGFIYLSDGAGEFSLSIIDSNYFTRTDTRFYPSGVSLADYDNDGLPDIFMAGVPGGIFRNLGNGNFTRVQSGFFSDSTKQLASWAVAVADADLDGDVDAIFTHPAGFLNQIDPQACTFLINNEGSFEPDTNYGFAKGLAPYTTASWIDYDDDGDPDLFIASGPGSQNGRDSIYQNIIKDSTEVDHIFTKSDLPFAGEEQNGQLYNGVDIDNDLDLDLILTNYNRVVNRLYLNEQGIFQEKESGFSMDGPALSNTWGDLDNDGDQDVIITYDRRGRMNAYLNDGEGNFTYDPCILGEQIGGTNLILGDYDKDGLLDMYISGWGLSRSLYHNNLESNNAWAQFDLEGSLSNRSAIGAKIQALANINGAATWQRRDISTQNAFNGHNALRVHFGLGNAQKIDSLIIIWPSGQIDTFADLQINSFYHIIEGDVITSTDDSPVLISSDVKIFPNPATQEINISIDEKTQWVDIKIFDLQGREIQHINTSKEQNSLKIKVEEWVRGHYFIRLVDHKGHQLTKQFLLQ